VAGTLGGRELVFVTYWMGLFSTYWSGVPGVPGALPFGDALEISERREVQLRREEADGRRVVVYVLSIMSPLGAISSVVSILVNTVGICVLGLEFFLNTFGIFASDSRGLRVSRVGVTGASPKRG